MTQRNEHGMPTFLEATGQDVSAYRAVKGNRKDGIQHCAAGEGSLCIGIVQEDLGDLDEDQHTVYLLGYGGTFLVEVGEAVSAGDKLYIGANGKFFAAGSGKSVVMAQEDATGDGSIIEASSLLAAGVGDGIPGLGSTGFTSAEATALGLEGGDVAFDSYGNKYMFVLNDNVNGAAIGTPLGIRTAGSNSWDVSDDLAASDDAGALGPACSTFASTDVYGWMLVEGDLETALDGDGLTLVTDGNVAALDYLFWGADGVYHGLAHDGTAADHKFVGQALKADSSTDLTVGYINAFGAGFNMA